MQTLAQSTPLTQTNSAAFLLTRCYESFSSRSTRLRRIEELNLQVAELGLCARHPVHWIKWWCYTYDPRMVCQGVPSTLPFALFPRQEQFIEWLGERERLNQPGLVEKSRDTGVSWLCCAYAVHGWLFKEGYAAGFGSLKWDEVDEIGSMGTLLEKCRFIIRNLPWWMKPRNYRQKEHAKFCCIINPDNGATITGAGGDEMGRGGRKSIFVIDEAARVARPERVDAALSRTTDVRIDVSTPKGMNVFYKRRQALPPEQVFRIHWKDDPRYDDAWYQAMAKTLGDPVLVAQELDISYAGSEYTEWPAEFFEGLYFTEWPADLVCKVMAVDPSKGTKDRTGDYSAIVMLGINKDLCLWVDADLDNGRPVEPLPSSPDQRSICGDCLKQYKEFRPATVLWESNAFQSMAADAMLRYATARGVLMPITTVSHHIPKIQRIRGLAPASGRNPSSFHVPTSQSCVP